MGEIVHLILLIISRPRGQAPHPDSHDGEGFTIARCMWMYMSSLTYCGGNRPPYTADHLKAKRPSFASRVNVSNWRWCVPLLSDSMTSGGPQILHVQYKTSRVTIHSIADALICLQRWRRQNVWDTGRKKGKAPRPDSHDGEGFTIARCMLIYMSSLTYCGGNRPPYISVSIGR